MIKRKFGGLSRKTIKRKMRLNARKGTFKPIKPKKVPKGLDPWIKAIPMGQHGSGHLQKRLWRLTSDLCRIRDWHKYDGKCVATGKKLESWNHGQGGHFKSWQKCNGIYKYCIDNIHLQSAQSNSWGDKDDWQEFECELIRRYGADFVANIENNNAKTPLKITTDMILADIEYKIKIIEKLPEKPPYFERVMKLKP